MFSLDPKGCIILGMITLRSYPFFQYPAPDTQGQCLYHFALGISISGNSCFNCLFSVVSNVPSATCLNQYLANLESV